MLMECRSCERVFDSGYGWFSHATQIHSGAKESERAKEWISENNPNSDGMSKEHRQKLSESHKGQVVSEEQRKKISESLQGHDVPEAVMERMKNDNPAQTEKFKERMSGKNNPAKRPEVREKLSGENNPMKDPEVVEKFRESFIGTEWSEESKKNIRGKGNPNWKGGSHIGSGSGVYGAKWRRIRSKVLERDDYRCKNCGKSENLEVHHIEPVRKFDEYKKAHTMKNAITLCCQCHGKAESGRIEVEI